MRAWLRCLSDSKYICCNKYITLNKSLLEIVSRIPLRSFANIGFYFANNDRIHVHEGAASISTIIFLRMKNRVLAF